MVPLVRMTIWNNLKADWTPKNRSCMFYNNVGNNAGIEKTRPSNFIEQAPISRLFEETQSQDQILFREMEDGIATQY